LTNDGLPNQGLTNQDLPDQALNPESLLTPEAAAAEERAAEIFSAHTFRRIFLMMVGLLFAGVPIAWAKFGPGMALSFSLGGVISLANFYWLKRTLTALVNAVALKGETRSAAGIVFRFVLRYLLIAVASYVIFKSSEMSMLGLCMGLSLPVAAVLFEAVYTVYGALQRGF
jgi:small-conductance mechanosensitive channel